jgi:hypothetical protein
LFQTIVAPARPNATACLKLKIFSKGTDIVFKDRGRFVVHFQLQNCGTTDVPLDFYGNLGYIDDTTCNIYFHLMKGNSSGQFMDYEYGRVNYKNGIDSMMQLKPTKIYSFYLPLFEVYNIKEPGTYRIQGFYRFVSSSGEYYTQSSNYLDIVVK